MGTFLTVGESFFVVDFSAAPGWLKLPAPYLGFPQLLAPTQRDQTLGLEPVLLGSF
jgi:hypothetical protein